MIFNSGYLITLDSSKGEKRKQRARRRKRTGKLKMDIGFKGNGFLREERKKRSDKFFLLIMDFSKPCKILL